MKKYTNDAITTLCALVVSDVQTEIATHWSICKTSDRLSSFSGGQFIHDLEAVVALRLALLFGIVLIYVPSIFFKREPVTRCLFVSDLHGREHRYGRLLDVIEQESPEAVFLGGDLLPSPFRAVSGERVAANFVADLFAPRLRHLRDVLGRRYPQIFLIMGNDDPRSEEPAFLAGDDEELWHYLHERSFVFHEHLIYGYACIPPTPFSLKDWERYDVSRFVDPGCLSPEEGFRTVPAPESSIRYGTIQDDLQRLAGHSDLQRAVFLFHSPPYQTSLDRAALDHRYVDHVPLDVHVGSVAIRRFIEQHQPWLTLHGHIHESARITGSWQQRIGNTFCFGAAHDGPELALVRFDLEHPEHATRELI